MSDRPLGFGLVGAGAIAQAYAQAFSDLELAQIVAVADVRVEAALSLAEPLGCPSYVDHDQMLEGTDCDAVLVCTPPASHPQICLDVLERKIPVLCEKPLSVDAASARRMVAAAEDAGVMLTMASKFRFVEDVIRAKHLTATGVLGEIVQFENCFAAHVEMSSRWNSDPKISGGGVLIDNGTHSVDLIRYFLGPIAEVNAVESRRIQPISVEDTVRILVRTEGGVIGSIDLSWSLEKHLESFIDIYGSHGLVRVGWRTSRYRQTGSPDWVVFGRGYDKIQAFRRQLGNFCKAIRGEEPLRIDAADAIASVEVIEAAYASLRERGWVSVGIRSDLESSPDHPAVPSGPSAAEERPNPRAMSTRST